MERISPIGKILAWTQVSPKTIKMAMSLPSDHLQGLGHPCGHREGVGLEG